MNIAASPVTAGSAAPLPTSDDKRLQLQTALLRKMLDLQKEEGQMLANEIQGKGSIVDIRV